MGLTTLTALLRIITTAALVALICGIRFISASAAPGPLTRTDYATVAPSTNDYAYWSEQVKSSTRVVYESDFAGQRGVVQRIEVQPGDTNVFGSGTGERAEVTAQGTLGGFLDGQTIVLSWSTIIDSEFESPPDDWNNFVQIHAAGGKAASPWQLNLAGADAGFKMRLSGGGDWSMSSSPAGAVLEWLPLGRLSKNEWHDFVLELHFSCTGTGYATVWLDGQQIVDAQNRMIGYCGDPGMYWKQGFYRSAYSKTTRLWFDDTLWWGNTNDAFSHYGWATMGPKSPGG